jgi:hypothetical protein
MASWPDETIRSAALRYIRKHVAREVEWRFTRLDALHARLARIAHIEGFELPVVTQFARIDGNDFAGKGFHLANATP